MFKHLSSCSKYIELLLLKGFNEVPLKPFQKFFSTLTRCQKINVAKFYLSIIYPYIKPLIVVFIFQIQYPFIVVFISPLCDKLPKFISFHPFYQLHVRTE